ncbi:hypothetical protein GT020_11840 [Glutamicibacter soli]|uniref:Uncharacterized protein n=1 Tax=Glutamicibacter soli TaxID=453836 RepID=A0A6L9G6B4_9MICC|nr:conjugal transfer protein TraC [Glutamicibacter soli]NAZ16749.1 hypothetical protein [Glutamicibacter soli]
MQYLLKGRSLQELQDKAIADFGPQAYLVSAEKITTPRAGGLLREFHYEAVIQVREEPVPAPVRRHRLVPVRRGPRKPAEPAPARQAPAAGQSVVGQLLERVEAAELQLAGQGSEPAKAADFDAVLDAQSFSLYPAAGRRAANPEPAAPTRQPQRNAATTTTNQQVFRGQPGDLVLLIGKDADALTAAMLLDGGSNLIAHTEPMPASANLTPGIGRGRQIRPVAGRRAALEIRAEAVAEETCVLLVMPLASTEIKAEQEKIRSLDADQLVLVVDARHKAEDTALWVGQVAEHHAVAGIIALHSDGTSTPETVESLGYPVRRLPA